MFERTAGDPNHVVFNDLWNKRSSEGYVLKQPVGLSLVRVPNKQSRELALVGGVGNDGQPLWVSLTDRTNLARPVALTELGARGEERRFRLTAVSPGSTTVEARQGGASGALQDSVLIEVAAAANSVIRTGPRLGHNGEIPPELRTKLRTAIEVAWRLNNDPRFVETFRDVVSTLSGTPKPITVYAETLNRTVIHLLDTTKDTRVKSGLAAERQDVRDHAVSGVAPSYSFRLEPNIWIRRSAFDKGTRQLAPRARFDQGVDRQGRRSKHFSRSSRREWPSRPSQSTNVDAAPGAGSSSSSPTRRPPLHRARIRGVNCRSRVVPSR